MFKGFEIRCSILILECIFFGMYLMENIRKTLYEDSVKISKLSILKLLKQNFKKNFSTFLRFP